MILPRDARHVIQMMDYLIVLKIVNKMSRVLVMMLIRVTAVLILITVVVVSVDLVVFQERNVLIVLTYYRVLLFLNIITFDLTNDKISSFFMNLS